MKRLLPLLITVFLVSSLQCGGGSGSPQGGSPSPGIPPGGEIPPDRDGPLKGFSPIAYGCIHANRYGDVLVILGDGYIKTASLDANKNILGSAENALTGTQMEEVKGLLSSADFNFSGNMVEYGSEGSGTETYAIMVKFDTSSEKKVAFWGENPSGASAEYIALRDYLKALYRQYMK